MIFKNQCSFQDEEKKESYMTKKKISKIKDDVSLSIKYAILKNVVSSLEEKKEIVGVKRAVIIPKAKKLEKADKEIEDTFKVIKSIENNYKLESYSLVVDNKVKTVLNFLQKRKDIELIKYEIVLRTILDADLNYDEINPTFIEELSLLLFNNKYTFKDILDNYEKILNIIRGTTLKKFFESAAGKLAKLSMDQVKQVIRIVPQKIVPIAIMGAAIVGLAALYYKMRKQTKKMSTLEPGVLSIDLTIIALNLLYSKKLFDSEIEYRLYFKSILREVNRKRLFIMKNIFEDQREIEVNAIKIELFHNFDKYMIELLKEKK